DSPDRARVREHRRSLWTLHYLGPWPSLWLHRGRLALMPSMLRSTEGKQQKQRNQQREDAERLGDGEAKNQVGKLSGRRRGIPNRRGQVVAEDDADADASTPHADAGNPSTNVFRGRRIHEKAPVRWLLVRSAFNGRDESHR